MVVWKAVHDLVHNSDLYKGANVQGDAARLETMNNIENENIEFVTTMVHNDLQSLNSIIDNKEPNDEKLNENMNELSK